MVDNMTFLIQTKRLNGYLEERLAKEITASFQRIGITNGCGETQGYSDR